jgi:ubiquinone/menaquinone biosynthesis C-methylase UbiE
MPKLSGKLPSGIPLFIDLMCSGWSTFTIVAAVQLDVFTTIASGKATAAQIAAESSANDRAMRRLLDALVALKYLARKGERYSLTPPSATFLSRTSDLYMDGIGEVAPMLMMGWPQLAETVKKGSALTTRSQEDAAQFFTGLIKCIFPQNYVAARAAVAALDRSARARIKNVLDVAGGAAAWSIPFAEALKTARVTVADFPQVTQVTRAYARKFEVEDRFDYLEGDLEEIDLGKDAYDLVILGHIIHTIGREAGQRLIERCSVALSERGLLLIAEFIPNDDRTGPALPMLFGLNMLIRTPNGDVFTMRDYREWLKRAGFRTIKSIRTPVAPSALILALK